MDMAFSLELRGYDRQKVDEILGRATAAMDSASQAERSAMAAELRSAQFGLVMRGYSRRQVDAHIQRVGAELSRG